MDRILLREYYSDMCVSILYTRSRQKFGVTCVLVNLFSLIVSFVYILFDFGNFPQTVVCVYVK